MLRLFQVVALHTADRRCAKAGFHELRARVGEHGMRFPFRGTTQSARQQPYNTCPWHARKQAQKHERTPRNQQKQHATHKGTPSQIVELLSPQRAQNEHFRLGD